jgi:hypothetical protein
MLQLVFALCISEFFSPDLERNAVSFDLWVRNEIALSINDAFRMPHAPR